MLQLNGEGGPVSQLLAKSGNNTVRGYMQWTDEISRQPEADGALAWLGNHIKLSTVRDMGIGQEQLKASPESILESFASLGGKTVGVDDYTYLIPTAAAAIRKSWCRH